MTAYCFHCLFTASEICCLTSGTRSPKKRLANGYVLIYSKAKEQSID